MKKNLLRNKMAYSEMEILQNEFVESNNVGLLRKYLADSTIRTAHIEIAKELLQNDEEAYNQLAKDIETQIDKRDIFKLYLIFRNMYFESVEARSIIRFVEAVRNGEYSVEELISRYCLMGEYGFPSTFVARRVV